MRVAHFHESIALRLLAPLFLSVQMSVLLPSILVMLVACSAQTLRRGRLRGAVAFVYGLVAAAAALLLLLLPPLPPLRGGAARIVRCVDAHFLVAELFYLLALSSRTKVALPPSSAAAAPLLPLLPLPWLLPLHAPAAGLATFASAHALDALVPPASAAQPPRHATRGRRRCGGACGSRDAHRSC